MSGKDLFNSPFLPVSARSFGKFLGLAATPHRFKAPLAGILAGMDTHYSGTNSRNVGYQIDVTASKNHQLGIAWN